MCRDGTKLAESGSLIPFMIFPDTKQNYRLSRATQWGWPRDFPSLPEKSLPESGNIEKFCLGTKFFLNIRKNKTLIIKNIFFILL